MRINFSRLLAVWLFAGLITLGSNPNIATLAQDIIDGTVLEIASALDVNANGVIGDEEIRSAIQLWIAGTVVPGTNRSISDVIIRKLIQIWITGQKIAISPTGSIQIDGVFLLDLTAKGEVVVDGPSLEAAPSGSMVTIIGADFPKDPMVQIDGIETGVFANNEETLVTFVPRVGKESKTVDIVISDKKNPSVFGKKSFTIDPLITQSVTDPKKTILDFIKASRTALTNEKSSSEMTDVLELLDKLENVLPVMSEGERRSIAASVKNSNVLTFVSKLQEKPKTATGTSVNQRLEPQLAITAAGVAAAVGIILGALSVYSAMGIPPDVTFEAISNQEPVEGDQQSFTCVANDGDEIDNIIINMRDDTDAHFIGADGKPHGRRTLVKRFGRDKETERFSVKWNSDVTGHVRLAIFTCTAEDDPWFQFSKSATRVVTFTPLHEAKPPEVVKFEFPKTVVVGQEFNIDVEVNDEFSKGRDGRPSGILSVFLSNRDDIAVNIIDDKPIEIGQSDPILQHSFWPAVFSHTFKATCDLLGSHEITLESSDVDSHKDKSRFDIDVTKPITCIPPDGQTDQVGMTVDPPSGFAGSETRAFVSIKGGKPPYAVGVSLPWGNFSASTTTTSAAVLITIPKDQRPGDYQMGVTVTDSDKNSATVTSTLKVLACPGQENQSAFGPHQNIEKDEGCPEDKAPLIVDIDAPTLIDGNGQKREVTVEFEDLDGDLAQVRFQTLQGPGAVNPPQTFSLTNVAGLTRGTFTFSIFCQNNDDQPFNVTDEIVLIDGRGLESSPRTYTYTCQGTTPPPPSFIPIIEDISFVPSLPAGTTGPGTVFFSDRDGDVIKIDLLNSTESKDETFDTGVPGLTSGSIAFHVVCSRDTNTRVAFLTIVLRDSQGNSSQPRQISYTCEGNTTPPPPPSSFVPIIDSISFPNEIFVTQTGLGNLFFSDPDGDIVSVTLQRGSQPPATQSLALPGQTSGSFPITSGCGSAPETVAVTATLQDSQGNTSQPMQFSYTCVVPLGGF